MADNCRACAKCGRTPLSAAPGRLLPRHRRCPDVPATRCAVFPALSNEAAIMVKKMAAPRRTRPVNREETPRMGRYVSDAS